MSLPDKARFRDQETSQTIKNKKVPFLRKRNQNRQREWLAKVVKVLMITAPSR
jgi:hypothetical protein